MPVLMNTLGVVTSDVTWLPLAPGKLKSQLVSACSALPQRGR